ncbi:MAG: transglycosylase domain-containing protein [Bacilli bacterium]|nr:transglycosylase domain-containing protein [Bacilli bacterium]MDD4406634.1 transglycosylase domain-containing protein [Bacilli bacterium]
MKKKKTIKKKINIPNINITKTKLPKIRKFKNKNIGEKILTIFMIGLIAITLTIVAFMLIVIIGSPNFSEEALYSKESSIIYDVEGNEYARLGSENRKIVSYDDLPEVFIDAILATEDSRFMQHSGVDLARFLKASFGQILGNNDAGGASTITMQIVKQRFTDNTATGIKGIIRKFTDVYMAVFKIEKKYTKEQILEFYVNIPYLGGGSHGIEQASQIYFNKSIGEVTLTEAATLAGLFQAPSAYDPYIYPEKAEARRNQVLNLMKRHNYITDEECELAKAIPIATLLVNDATTINQDQGIIDTIVEEVENRTDQNPYLVSMRIYSTFNPKKQEVINNIYNGTSYKWPNDALQAGIAVIDVKTGGITAIGAGRNKVRKLGFNFATMNSRHPGSTAKPLFDYGPAIEYLNWGTGQMIIDDVHGYSNGVKIKNFDNSYRGIMTAKTALAASRNIPALQAFQAVPQIYINEFVTGLGLTPEYDSTGFINEAHSIGGYTGSNPVQLAAAYATFARGGIYIEPHSFTKIEFVKTGDTYIVTPEKRTVMKDSTAYMINNILRFAITNGHVPGGSVSGTDLCGKTGTSTVDSARKKELKLTGDIIGDSWVVGYSPDYAIATWVGYKDIITKEYYLTNSLGSSTRNAIAKKLNSGILEKNSKFKKPSSVVSATIELETNPVLLASEYTPSNLKSVELFRKGTAPSETSTRFSKLNNPSDLSVKYENGKTTLSWNATPIPDAISSEYLTGYYNEGYGKWANKYLIQRINYNASNIGNIGYQIYINTGTGLRDLGWTSATTFIYNEYLNTNATFTVKSSYSIFKSNMSEGISKNIDVSNVINAQLSIGNCVNLSSYQSIINLNQPYIKVLESGTDITKNIFITNECYYNNNKINCDTMTNENIYTIKPTIKYNGAIIPNNITLNINPSC